MKRIMGLMAAIVMGFAGVVVASSPAQAVTINGCKDDNICLYDHINNVYSSGFWQRSITDIGYSNDGYANSRCMNLNDMKWHDLNGSPNNTASSFIINAQGVPGQQLYVYFRENLCGGGGAELIYSMPGNATVVEENLASANKDFRCYNYTCSWNWYDRVSSIQVAW